MIVSYLSWNKISGVTSVAEVKAGYRAATLSMARLNRIGAQLMHKYGATAATDVTGFGILGHATNLAQNQVSSSDIFCLFVYLFVPKFLSIAVLFKMSI